MAERAHMTKDQEAFFHEFGYLVLENVLTHDERAHYIDLVNGLDRRYRADQQIDDGAFVEIRTAIDKDHRLLPLLTYPRAFPVLAELMGPNIQLNTSHTMVCPPQPQGTSAEFKRIGWHRDGANAGVPVVHGTYPWLYTKIGYFLTDLSRTGMGGLRVIPGSHKRAELPPTRPDEIDPPDAVEVTVPAGSAILFQQRLWHAVGPNLSEVTRKNIYLGYCYRWVKPLDYIVPNPELLAVADPIERQLLGEYCSERTFWRQRDDELPLKAWLARHQGTRTDSEPAPVND